MAGKECDAIYSGLGQLDEKGVLGPITESCISRANKTFISRAATDTDPFIVKMIFAGKEVPHWYYRSNEWIDQPFYSLGRYLLPYVGPVEEGDPYLYGEGTYIIERSATEFVRSLLSD